ncbi:hypothetical protein, partial [Mycoplasmopsis arginini]|uniref:hypothetical protein n=1 Tax=Mycoplasmopsis arginini TaxID=2094 RepID=UPI00249DD5C1
NSVFIDSYGKPIQVTTEYFTYDGSSLSFTVLNTIDSVVTFDINGLVEDEGVGFEITSSNEVTIQGVPVLNSRIGVTYLY